MTRTITVLDNGHRITFTYDDIMKYHGTRYPVGVALALQVMERAFPLLDGEAPLERREIRIATPLTSLGARDAFEMVTRAVTEDRLMIAPALAKARRSEWMTPCVFLFTYRDRAVRAMIRDEVLPEEFIRLTAKVKRTAAEEERLVLLRQEMAGRARAAITAEVCEAEVVGSSVGG
jgi:hypothetical protein